jgi:predicted O-methyltransferase YrrM
MKGDLQSRWERLLGNAASLLPRYLETTRELSHALKGIRRSELFFFYAIAEPLQPRRIVESGRARAQSTLVLARLFPRIQVVSLESDAASPDVAIAEERLRGCENVDCRFGDSLQILPQLIEPGDIVLIDGPKDFRAMKLALRLLRDRKPKAVFVHDLWLGSAVRRFVDRYLPSALLSDDPRWVERYASLDSNRPIPSMRASCRRAYGATLGCLEPVVIGYRLAAWQCLAAQGADRFASTVRKILHRSAPARLADFEMR